MLCPPENLEIINYPHAEELITTRSESDSQIPSSKQVFALQLQI